MENTMNIGTFQSLSYDETLLVDGGTWAEAFDVAAMAITITGIAFTPIALVLAVGPVALCLAAATGIGAVISLVSSLTD